MRRFVIRGLRGRLLLALVATSIVTLAVVAAVTLSPLQQRLRAQGQRSLETATVEAANGPFATLAERYRVPSRGERTTARRGEELSPRDRRIEDLANALRDPAVDLQDRTGAARVLYADSAFSPPPFSEPSEQGTSFLYDTSPGFDTATPYRLAVEASTTGERAVDYTGDTLEIAVPVYADSALAGVLVTERRLTEVTTAVGQVRNALLIAALVGLAVAILLGIAISSGLTRRLARLRRAALRITAEGPDAPAPHDDGRDEVGDLARALARMQEELRRQETARRAFVATASHELRTPLTMLSGTMELLDEDLRDGADLEDAQDQVVRARRELRRLNALASELLDLSRLDAAVQLRTEDVELSEIARAVAAEFALQAADRDIRVDAHAPAAACWGRGDPDAVARVVRILLDNAMRHAPAGSAVTVSTRCDATRARIEVADRGPGVPAEERGLIFERFHRGRSASAESGFGLGLAIGRELAVRMGGSLELAEPDGREPGGARFVLTVPPASSSPSRSPAPGSAAAA
jgi:signal transduction histidine kinase